MTNRFAAKYEGGSEASPQGEPSGSSPSAAAPPPANRFAAKYEGGSEASPPQQAAAVQPPPSSGNSFMDGVENFNRQFERMALGIEDKLVQAAGIIPGMGDASQRGRDALRTYNQMQQRSADEAAARSPKSAMAGSILGAIGTGVAYGGAPISAAATLPAKIAAGAGVGAGLGYADYADTEGDRIKKGIVGGLIGGAIPAVAGLAKGAYNAVKGGETSGAVQKMLNPEAAALKDVAYRMGTAVDGDVDALAAAAAPAERLGIKTLTPGQVAMGTVDDTSTKTAYTAGADQLRAKEISLQGSDEVKRAMVENEKASIGKTSKYVNDTIEAMAPENAKGIQKEAFQKLNTEFVRPDGTITSNASESGVLDIIGNNAILANKWKEVKGAQSKAIQELPDNSLGQLHAMRASIDEDLKSATSTKLKAADKPLSRDVKLSLIEAKKELDGVLDKSDTFSSAMQITKQMKIKEGYQELLAKAPNPYGTKLPTFDSVHKTLFGSPQKVDEFLKNVAATKGDVKQAEDIIAVSGQLYKSTLARVAKRIKTDESGVFQAYGSKEGIISNLISKVTTARYSRALTELTLSGDKWKSEIARVLAAKGAKQTENWLGLILKAGMKNEGVRTFGVGAARGAALGGARSTTRN